MAEPETLQEQLVAQVARLLGSVWERRADLHDIDEWLGQFDFHEDPARSERLQALFLLSQFIYFGQFEVRALLRSLHRDHIRYPVVERFRRENGDTTDRAAIDAAFAREMERTRFVGLGNPSESSSFLLYFFRQENGLSKDHFLGTGDVFHFLRSEAGFSQVVRDPNVSSYVLIDDLCGSGRQVERYSDDVAAPLKAFAERDGRHVEVSYIALFGTTEGMKHVRDLGTFDRVECVVELDASFRCFDQKSRYFANEAPPVSRAFAEEVGRKYGARLVPAHPVGYEEGQLLLGFNHNTPDNTLPIFSFDEPDGPSWIPVFKRYAKVLQ